MKKTGLNSRLLLVSIGLAWLNAGCDTGDNGTTPQSGCRIQRIVSTTKGGFGATGTAETAYDYDAAGNLLKKTETNAQRQSAESSSQTTTTETYAYDAGNFLTDYTYSLVQKSDFYGNVSNYQVTQNKVYTYADNRLTGYRLTSVVPSHYNAGVPQQVTTVITGTYEYDAAGQLVKEIIANGPTRTYRNGQLVSYGEGDGSANSQSFTLENGLVVQARFPGTNSTGTISILKQVRGYDEQRRLIKHQEFVNDSLSRYHTQEWQTGKPAALAIPLFKGHPVIREAYGEPGVLIKYREYAVNKLRPDPVYQFVERTYTNQLNAQGYVTDTRKESMYFTNGQKQPDVTTTTYTYTGCN